MKKPNAFPRALRPILRAALLTLFAACVTVNVNFPESTVQRATDDYVRDLYRARDAGKGAATPSPAPASGRSTQVAPAWPALDGLLVASAVAAEDFKLNSPKAATISARQKGRISDVLDYKRKGILGESADGFLVLHKPDLLKKLETKKVEKLVADENADRKELYDDVVASNGSDKVQLPIVKKSFMRSFQAASPSGTWVEGADGKWEQKP